MDHDEIAAASLKRYQAKLPWMLNEDEITVGVKGEASWQYRIIRPHDDMALYVASGMKFIGSDHEIEECLFLPITVGEFSRHWKLRYGDQLRFTVLNETIVQMFNRDDLITTSLKIQFRANRFAYRTKGRDKIFIESISATPLTTEFEIHAHPDDINKVKARTYLEYATAVCRSIVLRDF